MTIDPIALKLAEIVLKWGWDKTASQIDKIDFNDPANKAKLDRACEKYIDSYRHRYGKISVLGMPKPAELENIYTNVQIIEGRNLWRYQSLLDQEQAYRDASRRRFQSDNREKQDGISIANKHQYLMVLGQPGAGKSTFLKRIGLSALLGKEDRSRHHLQTKLPGLKSGVVEKQQLLTGTIDPQPAELYIHELVPVLIELKRCDSEKIDLVEKIQSELETCGFESANMLTQTLLSKGGMLILLDGLDEIPSQHLNRAITQIQDFVNKYKENRFIISCRTAAYQGGFNNLVNVEMADFDDEQIQQFINNWFCKEQDLDVAVAESCWQLLNADGYQATKELAHTPLLLTFLCLVFDESQVFPKNRAALYKDALDILLRRWAAEKRIQRDPIYKDLTIQLEEMLLAKIAYEQFSQDRLFFDKQTVINEIQGYLAENLNAPKHLDGENVLRAIQIQQGILVGRSSDTLSFSHLTLQEYLTAQYIVDCQLIDELVSQHLTDSRWHEVFLMVAGLARNGGDSLLITMTIYNNKLINTKNLCSLVNWAREITKNANSDIDQPTRQCISLFIALANTTKNSGYELQYFSYVFRISDTPLGYHEIFIPNFINDLDNIVKSIRLIDHLSELQILKSLDYSGIKAKIQSLQSLEKYVSEAANPELAHREFSEKILQIWCKFLSMELEWLNLSDLETNNLGEYLQANLLIMKCKESAVYISKQGWSDVKESMFNVIHLSDNLASTS
jgi:hypothetical protein